jgi:hypothetical protein
MYEAKSTRNGALQRAVEAAPGRGAGLAASH